MNRVVNEKIASAELSKSQNPDHENSDSTLPQHPSNPIPGYSQNRAVMWTVPDQREGLRSKSPVANSALASDVKGSGHAQHVQLPGAAVADVESTQRTQFDDHVIEKRIDFEGSVGCETPVNEEVDGKDATTAHQMPATSIEQAFETIRAARQVLLQIDEERKQRKDTDPQPPTIANYERKVTLIDELARSLETDGGGQGICLALAQYAAMGQSYTAMRSAVLWRSIGRVQQLLKAQDRSQRTAPGSLAWALNVDALSAELHLLQQVRDLTLPAALALSGLEPRPSTSKKGTLLRINADWRSRFLRAAAKSKKYRMSDVVLACTGLRPIELEWGVAVRRRGRVVAMKILGGKVRATAGQPWRVLFIPAEQLPEWFLEAIGTAPRIVSAPANAMRAYLGRLSSTVFVPRKDGTVPILSAYTFRHALVTDMRAAGWGSEEMAGVLGERSARTPRWYGLRKRGSKAPLSAVSVARGSVLTALPVAPADKSWLAVKPSKPVKAMTSLPR